MVSVAVIAASVEPWQGIGAIVALAGAIGYLFRWAVAERLKSETALAARDKAHGDELARVRLECETRIAAQTKQYADAIRQEHLDNRAHEDEVRKEFVSVVATVSDQTTKSAEALTEVLGRLHDRFAGPSRPRH